MSTLGPVVSPVWALCGEAAATAVAVVLGLSALVYATRFARRLPERSGEEDDDA